MEPRKNEGTQGQGSNVDTDRSASSSSGRQSGRQDDDTSSRNTGSNR